MPRRPELRDELVAMAGAELDAADAFFARCAAEPALDAELEGRLGGPIRPLIAALDGWDGAPPEADALLEINARNGRRLAEIVTGGWPGLREVGADGADSAWLLAQHADRINDERRDWLAPLRAAVEAGEADPRHLACLADRVAVMDRAPQEYGTLIMLATDGEPEFPVPVRDALRLEERRAAIGLPSIADELPSLASGDLVPYGPDRGTIAVNQWPLVVEGHVSVEAALAGGARRVHRVWAVRPGDRRLGRLRALAREAEVQIDEVQPQDIDELATGRTHGGVVGLVGARRLPALGDLLGELPAHPLVVMLDGVEDPFNYGQAVRALYAAGVDALAVRRSWETALGTVTRASAGATELMPTASVPGAEQAAAAARRAGLRVAVAVADPEATSLHQADLRPGTLLLIGGERRGVTRAFVDQADLRVRIPYGRAAASALGTAASAAVVAFEALRQRGEASAP